MEIKNLNEMKKQCKSVVTYVIQIFFAIKNKTINICKADFEVTINFAMKFN